MAHLENLTPGAAVKGIMPDRLVTVVQTKWFGSNCIELTYKDSQGKLGNELLYRTSEPSLEITTEGRPWSFDEESLDEYYNETPDAEIEETEEEVVDRAYRLYAIYERKKWAQEALAYNMLVSSWSGVQDTASRMVITSEQLELI